MSGISASGLVSGIDTDAIVEQLIAIEQKPIATLQGRTSVLQSQQAAFTNINAQLLGIQTAMKALTQPSAFRATTANTSNEQILTASSSSSATPGSYSFLVSRLVSSQQSITRGFGDLNTAPLPGGTLTFERGEARLDRQTRLDSLNGGAGVRRGYIRVTDRDGGSAVIDLTRAVSVDDVLNQINNNTNIRVLAEVDGDKLKITDLSGGAGDLIVGNIGTSNTATSLGLLGNSAGGDTITGTIVNTVGRSSVLAVLNDGNGISKHGSLDDFRITTAGGGSYTVSLANATNLGNVIDEIEAETGGDVTAAIGADGLGLVLTDTTGGGASFTVTALNGSSAASDLGILGDDSDADGEIGGDRLTGTLNSKLVRNLNGGNGVDTLGTISIQNRAGTTTAVDLSGAVSIADIVTTINAAGAGVTASLNNAGNGLLITDDSGGTGDIVIGDSSGTTATDLNIAGTFSDVTTVDSGNLQFKYITAASSLDTLNITRGKFTITDSAGKSATVDLTQGDEKTIGDVIREINSRGLQIIARINDNGDGIYIEDNNAVPISKLKIEESGSTTAADLGLLGEAETIGGDIDGSFEKTITITANVLETTSTLATLNDGEGIDNTTGSAEFTFTTRDGNTHDIDLDGVTTIDELITAISTQTGGSVTASINAIETGLKLTDNTSGSETFKVEAIGNSDAADQLGILKSDNNDDGVIGGNSIVEITTLQDLATKITNAKVGVTASVINDGTPGDPYRLSFASSVTGSRGAFVFDDGGLGFGNVNLAKAQDAVVFFGGGDPANSVALTSSSNNLNGVIPGVNVTLKTASSEAVTVTVDKNTEAVATNVGKFVEAFNTLVNNIHTLDSYDVETQKRGLLLGDSTLSQIESQLYSAVIRRNNDVGGTYVSLTQLGITVSGGTLQFDQAKFQTALANDPESVENLFTFRETEEDDDGEDVVVGRGVGHTILDLLDRLTDSDGGVVDSRIDTISRQITQNNDRIEFLQGLIEDKRARLERQFAAMEQALARMQDQSSALSSLSTLASQIRTNNSNRAAS